MPVKINIKANSNLNRAFRIELVINCQLPLHTFIFIPKYKLLTGNFLQKCAGY